MCEHKSTENASSQSRPCAKISTMSDNRSSVVNLSRRIALAPRTRRRSRPHGAHRGGLGQVNSAGRDVAEYNSAQAYVFNVFGWLAEAARS